jgi:hypothetical protein
MLWPSLLEATYQGNLDSRKHTVNKITTEAKCRVFYCNSQKGFKLPLAFETQLLLLA